MTKSLFDLMKKKGTKSSSTPSGKEKVICTVVISCFEPSEDGHMQVEMTYEGDKVLASYLVKSAQGMLEKD